jgi:hypothetical protein
LHVKSDPEPGIDQAQQQVPQNRQDRYLDLDAACVLRGRADGVFAEADTFGDEDVVIGDNVAGTLDAVDTQSSRRVTSAQSLDCSFGVSAVGFRHNQV